MDAVLVQVGGDPGPSGMDADRYASIVGGGMTRAEDTDGDIIKRGHGVKINDLERPKPIVAASCDLLVDRAMGGERDAAQTAECPDLPPAAPC